MVATAVGSRRLGKALLTFLAVAVWLMSGCGGDSPSGEATSRTTTSAAKADSGSSHQDGAVAETSPPPLLIPGPPAPIRYQAELKIKPSGLAGSEPKPVIPKAHPSDRIAMKELFDGIGTYAFEGAKVTLQYVGYDYKTGKKFASSWDQGRPVTFTLGAGEVVPAWEEALNGMEVGDRRVVVAPPKLAKGSYPPNVPRGKTVVFILETLPAGSEPKAEAASSARLGKESGKEPKVALPKGPPPKELVIKDLKEGTGPIAQAGDEAVFHYVEVGYETGKEFDSSWDRGRPFRFTLGSHKLILGWEEGLKGMRVGGRRELIAPPPWAFEAGGAGNVPPDTTLVFVVDLLEIK